MEMTFSDYSDLIDDSGNNGFPRKHLRSMFKLIYLKACVFRERTREKYLKQYNIDIYDYIDTINLNLFERALLDAFDDLKRIKTYHDVSNPVNIKYAAYISYWWIQRKPFQMNNKKISKDFPKDSLIRARILNFNEFFALYFVLSMTFKRKSIICMIEDENEWPRAEKYLFYFFCFRASSPKSIEAFLSASILHPKWEIAKNIC